MDTVLFRRFTFRPVAFHAILRSQTEREAALADFELHAARIRVCVGLAALAGVGCGISGQPVLEVGVVCADMNQQFFLIETDSRDFLAFSPANTQHTQPLRFIPIT